MPIERYAQLQRLPRLGKVHLGIKVKNPQGVEHPQAVDYFVCPPEVQAIYGEQPRQLDIVFPVDDTEIVAPQYYRAYSRTRGLVCKGTGVRANRLVDVATKGHEEGTGVVTGDIAHHDAKEVEYIEGITCPGQACPYYTQKDCKEVMNLQFLLPTVPGLGVWQLDTSSFFSILNVNSGLDLIRRLFGTFQGVPLELRLIPQEVAPDGKKKTVRVLQVTAPGTLEDIARTRLQFSSTMYALPAPEVDRPPLLYAEVPNGGGQENPVPEDEVSQALDEDTDRQEKGAPPAASSAPGPRVTEAGAFWDQAVELGFPSAQEVELALGKTLGTWKKTQTYTEALDKLREVKASQANPQESGP